MIGCIVLNKHKYLLIVNPCSAEPRFEPGHVHGISNNVADSDEPV